MVIYQELFLLVMLELKCFDRLYIVTIPGAGIRDINLLRAIILILNLETH